MKEVLYVPGLKKNLLSISALDKKGYISIPIKGIGESSYKLDSRTSMKMKERLYVPGFKKNLLSILALDKKGYRVTHVDQRKYT